MMALFKKEKRVVDVGGQRIELQPKPSLFSIFKKLAKGPRPAPVRQPGAQQVSRNMFQVQQPGAPQVQTKGAKKPGFSLPFMKPKSQAQTGTTQIFIPKIEAPKAPGMQTAVQQQQQVQQKQPGKQGAKPHVQTPIDKYINTILAKNSNIENQLKERNIATTPYQYVKRMFMASVMLAATIGLLSIVVLTNILPNPALGVIIGVVLALGTYQQAFRTFLKTPTAATKKETGKNIERDILFAARDMIISLRSGMPLFNALTSVSTGYGDASKEFSKIVNRVQLGMPLEEAIDATLADTKSPSFRKIMLQASVSIKAGADVVDALQAVIDQLSQERVIALRAYGQRLNALAMFYMLFGVIMPSMGIAVITILTTFIALFQVTIGVLEAVLVFIIILQVVFLKLIVSSRPVFTM